ncbi:MAG: ATP synthase F1 subunit gamma [Clostridiales bacterium]
MASMREIKLRIKSIKETRQITKAMKLISAAKLKRARQQLEHTLPYFNKVKATISDILIHSGEIESQFFDLRKEKASKNKAFFIITGDKSLAGGYNHNIIKLSEKYLVKDPDAKIFVAGHIGRNHFIRRDYNVDKNFDYFVQNPTVYRAREIADYFLDKFKSNEIDEISILYTEMVSSLNLQPKCIQLLPLEVDSLKSELKDYNLESLNIDESLIYEPSKASVFDVLIPKYLKGMIYGALVESFTSEQSARMSAMDNATVNADEMIQHLNLYYNRARQAAITQEISEIVGGAAALK